MNNYICITCGVQQAETEAPPEHCPICEDERQYIGHKGQRWTTIIELQRMHHNRIEEVDANLTGIGSVPAFGIGQRALLVQTAHGNVLWDCTNLLDEATIAAVRNRGGIGAIAVSHPHLAGALVEWSRAFDNSPIYWHADNRQWAMRPDPAYVFWEGEVQPLMEGITLIRCGGHFDGSTVLHWSQGADGRGDLSLRNLQGVSKEPASGLIIQEAGQLNICLKGKPLLFQAGMRPGRFSAAAADRKVLQAEQHFWRGRKSWETTKRKPLFVLKLSGRFLLR